ncbi:hypothetical protein EVAR_55458_1 [Eumeta japonica]|uniref:Uncharacterized protein n=1 Tax=Eumeta variegata TaxID=151549 RepID=A0A4C1Y2L6_EUMVA|nr:hypothetical protein EVAR_55458_1 [Eumeta japonica]
MSAQTEPPVKVSCVMSHALRESDSMTPSVLNVGIDLGHRATSSHLIRTIFDFPFRRSRDVAALRWPPFADGYKSKPSSRVPHARNCQVPSRAKPPGK